MSLNAFRALTLVMATTLFIVSATAAPALAQPADDFEAGRAAFSQCRACHSLSPSQNGRGPTLYRIFGRRAGTVPGYVYSLAMKNSAIVWTNAMMERYLTDPEKLIPGGKMAFPGIRDRHEMKALLAYLRRATR